MHTVSFARLRQLRDVAGTLGSRDLAAALDELIHLRSSREIITDDGTVIHTACDNRIEPEDLKHVEA